MFDTAEERKKSRKEQKTQGSTSQQDNDLTAVMAFLEIMDDDRLLLLRSAIDARLPPKALKDLNLQDELVTQFQVAKALQSVTITSEFEEANKKAQVLNTTATVLQQLVKMQSEYHTAERLKEIEARLIKSLEKIPEHFLVEFFKWYECEANQC